MLGVVEAGSTDCGVIAFLVVAEAITEGKNVDKVKKSPIIMGSQRRGRQSKGPTKRS